jgi:hypothetical protein
MFRHEAVARSWPPPDKLPPTLPEIRQAMADATVTPAWKHERANPRYLDGTRSIIKDIAGT